MPSEPDSGAPAEFDAYAAGYDSGLDAPLKRCLGANDESYLEVKADWLLRYLTCKVRPAPGDATRLLDYGCGTGTLMRVLRQRGFRGSIAGCDVSAGMLTEARQKWTYGGPEPFSLIENGRALFPAEHFELIVLCAVMHHVAIPDRHGVYADVLRLLKPGGRLFVFEHNPFNPLTRIVVHHTPIDKNAVLLTPGEVSKGLKAVADVSTRTDYLMFFPPRLRCLRPWERFLGWLPCGGQYVVVARKPV